MEPPFETVIFTQADEAKNLLMMRELKDAVENQQIRIVDIRRYRDQLIVTFRGSRPETDGGRRWSHHQSSYQLSTPLLLRADRI
ncbi:hypothetical protein GCM10025858_29290 [Alicyclobacillus sacchari]|uniref:hypothetical protein n=1 Tax=Alicyclobacillus sacchari TaxID=392010 RepID=UPI0023EA3742|nr:hypothetical protein [Alicyclobacillus sacchari]GMA58426.1 hypothetical protein GCM10025858_29290 [Alicyclobacillus sacchari]